MYLETLLYNHTSTDVEDVKQQQHTSIGWSPLNLPILRNWSNV